MPKENRKEALAEAREARKRPPPGQRCQSRKHRPLTPSIKLQKVYWEVGGWRPGGEGTPRKLCYEWWCLECWERDEPSEFDEGWPVGDDGKFMTPVQCDLIPGIDR
jgi:hypothetical protein